MCEREDTILMVSFQNKPIEEIEAFGSYKKRKHPLLEYQKTTNLLKRPSTKEKPNLFLNTSAFTEYNNFHVITSKKNHPQSPLEAITANNTLA